MHKSKSFVDPTVPAIDPFFSKTKQIEIKNYDAAKEMVNLLKFAKIASIRDIQKKEHIELEKAYKRKEEKMDLMMEIERLKELKAYKEKEQKQKILKKEGSLYIREQMKQRQLEREKLKEIIAKEKIELNKHIEELMEQDKKILEKKKIDDEKLAKEIEESNRITALAREKKKQEEREEDLKMHQYNLLKALQEQEELEKKRKIREERERETQKLRERQERAIDKQAELDEIRAKRSFEDEERKRREKEKKELELKQKQIRELIEGNEIQKNIKLYRLREDALQNQAEYDYIIKKQLNDLEKDRKFEEECKRRRYEHADELKRQMKEKEEKLLVERREVLEEGRAILQGLDQYKSDLERFKKIQLEEMEKFGIQDKYKVDLQNYKIK